MRAIVLPGVLALAVALGGCSTAAPAMPSTPAPTPTPTVRTPAPTTLAEGVDALLRDAVATRIEAGTMSLGMSMRFEGSSLIPDGTEIKGSGQLGASAGDGRIVGRQTVDGVQTTHVSSTLDLELALDRVPSGMRDALVINIGKVRGQGVAPTVRGDAWIADDGLIHRQRLEYRPSAMRGGGAIIADISMTDHGAPLSLPVPTEDETIEADDIRLPTPAPSG